MPVFTTACPRNCYSTCSMRVEVVDGRIRRIESHPGNLATPAGLCLRGLSHLERVVSGDCFLDPNLQIERDLRALLPTRNAV